MKPGVGRLEKVPVCRAGSCESSNKKKLKAKAKELHCGPGTSTTSEGLFSASQARSFTARDDAGKLSSERLKKATRKSKVLQSALRVSRDRRIPPMRRGRRDAAVIEWCFCQLDWSSWVLGIEKRWVFSALC